MNKRNSEVPHDTEDKGWWLQHGEQLELQFVKICNEKLNLGMRINPAKALDATAPDLLVASTLADLKVQNTPFFTAARYGVDPRYAVTFNRKDYERYSHSYPDIDIYYWIDWQQLQWKSEKISYLGGFYVLPFKAIAEMIRKGTPEHDYIHRRYDNKGNAKSSFILDIRTFKELFSTTKGGHRGRV